ncbi:hypothetical protein Tco_0651136, partial [Tanacetum coccineum]
EPKRMKGADIRRSSSEHIIGWSFALFNIVLAASIRVLFLLSATLFCSGLFYLYIIKVFHLSDKRHDAISCITLLLKETDISQKDENQAKSDKTGYGMEKCVKTKPNQSQPKEIKGGFAQDSPRPQTSTLGFISPKKHKMQCMRTRSKARRLQQQQQVPPNLVEPPKDTMADNRTMAELLLVSQDDIGSLGEEVGNGYEVFDGKHKGRFSGPKVMNRRSEGQHDYVDRQRYHVKVEISNFLRNLDLEVTLDWLYEVDKFFDIMYFPEEEQVKIVAYKLRGGAGA